MSGVWKDKDGNYILFKDLSDEHLLNIIRWVEKKAEGCIEVTHAGGWSPEDFYFEKEIKCGEDVLQHFNYKGLVVEWEQRGL